MKHLIYLKMCAISIRLILGLIFTGTFISCTGKTSDKTVEIPEFPLKISENKHYLTDQKGRPFLICGDSPWEIAYKLKQEEQLAYIDTAMQMGFNTFFIEALHWEKDPAYKNQYGESPFLSYLPDSMADFSTPNPAFFDRLHWLIQQLRDRNALILLVIADYSSYGPYWYDDVIANKETKCYDYAKYLANLLADCSNIIWIQGGDCDPGYALGMTEAMAQAIQDSKHPSKLQTYHAGARPSSQLFPHTTWITLNNTYAYDSTVTHGAPLYVHAYHDYFMHGDKPTFNLETGYEGESNDGHGGLPSRMRRQVWYTMLAGSCGHMYGSINWWFPDNWREVQQWPGAKHVTFCFNYLKNKEWWKLVPDSGHYLIPEEYATHNEYKIAAISEQKDWLLAYIPAAGHKSVVINLKAMNEEINTARWIDPTNGKVNEISGTPFKNSDNKQFEVPGKNGFGDDDWVLELSTKKNK